MQRLLPALLLAALVARTRAACSTELRLPSSGGGAGAPPAPPGDVGAVAPLSGFCPAYAATTNTAVATCTNLSVPLGTYLQFGTCALPGASCTGATALTLVDGANSSVSLTSAFTSVSLTSAVAKLAQGCVLGVRCSYGACAPRGCVLHLGADIAGVARVRRRVAQHGAVSGARGHPGALLRRQRLRGRGGVAR
jgi:hypothetical protein